MAPRVRTWLVWLGAALALLLGSPARAAEPPARVSVLTMGPGAHPFTRFGHNAILLEWDRGPRRTAVYNFGTFAFDGAQGVADFMRGRFRYWLSASSLETTLRVYGDGGRSLTKQVLRLSPRERAELAAKLAENALPQNRYYDYDYYRDNCSTRVRDAIDALLHGQLKRGIGGAGRLTFREHTLRLLADAPVVYAGLDLALGAATDRPTTRWEELFLPQELAAELDLSTRDLDGERVPLVTSKLELLPSSFPPTPSVPPERRPWFAAFGLAAGGVFAATGLGARRRRALGVAFGVWCVLWGALLGLLGCAFTWFWFFSKHAAAFQNRALLVSPPWALALAVLGIALLLGRPRAAEALRWVAALGVLGSVVLLALSVPAAGHEHLRLGLLFLPLWCGCFVGARAASQK
jgi:Domain of unknown function (DUF4105)